MPGRDHRNVAMSSRSTRRARLPMQLLCFALAFMSFTAQAQVRAWLDRDGIALGETATLNIETRQPDVDPPDYSPLAGDFRLSGHTSSRCAETINGQTDARMLFAVALQPRREGLLPIPPLRIGNARTPPLTLTVGPPVATVTPKGNSTVFIEAEADAASPYVQQAVGYTVRLYYATSLISGQLDQDAPEGATLQRIGEDLQYQREISGRRYTVVERRYLLIPERSGSLQVPGARFRGQGLGGFFDDLFGDGRRDLSARGAARTLNIRPMPANAPQPWLPLRALSLRYVATPQAARAGEAATVTVEMEADGASATQLPELQMPTPEGAQVFADPPQVEERFEQGRPHVRVVRRFSVVPAHGGALRLEGPSVKWWDVAAGAQRTASLPALDLDVAGGSLARGHALPPASAETEGPAQRWIRVPFVRGAVHAWALATVAFALLWLATLWWGLQRRRAVPDVAASRPSSTAKAPASQSAPALNAALAAGDLGAIAVALQSLATPPARDLDAVAHALEPGEQVQAVRALQQARWGQGDAAAALSALRSAFKQGPRWRRVDKPGKPLLAPLYPE